MIIDILIAGGISFAIALVAGICLALADNFLRVEEDPRIENVTGLLANANCGGCGYPGCSGFATAVVEKKVTSLSACKPTKKENKEKIQEYLASNPGPDGSTIKVTL